MIAITWWQSWLPSLSTVKMSHMTLLCDNVAQHFLKQHDQWWPSLITITVMAISDCHHWWQSWLQSLIAIIDDNRDCNHWLPSVMAISDYQNQASKKIFFKFLFFMLAFRQAGLEDIFEMILTWEIRIKPIGFIYNIGLKFNT